MTGHDVTGNDLTPRPAFASVVFDADSTLSAIEGIDWLGALRDEEVAAQIAELTNRAMDGLVSLDAVYAERVARIRPTMKELRQLSDAYIAHVVPGMAALIGELHALGVRTAIVSGGIREALLPLAKHLGIAHECVHAVELTSTANDDVLDALLGTQPLATSQGKLLVVEALLQQKQLSAPAVMVGDGATDAAARQITGAFIAFTGVVRRGAVVDVADYEAENAESLRALLVK